MKLIITLRKEVASREEGKTIYDLVKEHLADRPNVKVSGHVANHFKDEELPSDG